MKGLIAAGFMALAACATATGPKALDRFDTVEAEVRDFTGYDRVYLAPIEPGEALLERTTARRLTLRDRERPIDKGDVEAKLADLRDDLVREISSVATLVDEPGPGVLTIDVTVTELQANRPTMAEMRAEPGLDFSSFSVGDAAVEIELSEDGRPLAQLQDREISRQINDPAIGVGIWSTADRYFQILAGKVAALLT